MTDWGRFIRAERESRNLSQTALAELLDVSKSTVMDMEIGPKRKVDVERIIKVQAAFNLPFVVVLEAAGYDAAAIRSIRPEDLPPRLQRLVAEAEALSPEEQDRLVDHTRYTRERYGQAPQP